MNDHAKISLQVARIIKPNYEWLQAGNDLTAYGYSGGRLSLEFDYRTDAAGFQMVKWLAHSTGFDRPSLWLLLLCSDPNLALATAIIELKENG